MCTYKFFVQWNWYIDYIRLELLKHTRYYTHWLLLLHSQLARSTLSSSELEEAHQAVERDRATKKAQTESRAMSDEKAQTESRAMSDGNVAQSNGVAGGATPRVCCICILYNLQYIYFCTLYCRFHADCNRFYLDTIFGIASVYLIIIQTVCCTLDCIRCIVNYSYRVRVCTVSIVSACPNRYTRM